MPAPEMQAYPLEVAVAEKLHALVHLAGRNTRMKDYHDLRVLLESRRLAEDQLATAISSTFQRRGTPIPQGVPAGLMTEFARDGERIRQWNAFHKRLGIDRTHTLEESVEVIRSRLAPILAWTG